MNGIIILFLLIGHKINIFATVEGNKIYTQSYSSDGTKIKAGVIEVYDKSGNKLLKGETDSLGEFSFVIPKKEDLKIVLIGGLGHRAEITISKDELPEIKENFVKKKDKDNNKLVYQNFPVIDTTMLKNMIGEVVEEKLHPIVRMIAEGKRKNIQFTEIIGGIGYIVGIIGILAFFMKRNKNA